MKLDSLESGREVFIDANIFISHFTGLSNESSNFLTLCEDGDLTGITSINVVLEVLHRLMIIEAIRKNLASPPNVVKKLGCSPEKIKQLEEYFINSRKIPEMGIAIKPISSDIIFKSQIFRRKYGLMVNDSIVIAIMQEEGIKALATNDEVFLKIPEISVYKPNDVNYV
ncbi:MAG: PIN domain-containing protein [bacterium]